MVSRVAKRAGAHSGGSLHFNDGGKRLSPHASFSELGARCGRDDEPGACGRLGHMSLRRVADEQGSFWVAQNRAKGSKWAILCGSSMVPAVCWFRLNWREVALSGSPYSALRAGIFYGIGVCRSDVVPLKRRGRRARFIVSKSLPDDRSASLRPGSGAAVSPGKIVVAPLPPAGPTSESRVIQARALQSALSRSLAAL